MCRLLVFCCSRTDSVSGTRPAKRGGMKLRSLALSVLLLGCTASHPEGAAPPDCEASGGWCQTPDLPCLPDGVFVGYERCGPDSYLACCAPSPSDGGLER